MVGSVSERTSGRFWLADIPDRTVGGWLDTSGRWPLLELAEPLTPEWREVSRREFPNGNVEIVSEPADDDVQPQTVTVHGFLRSPASLVTLVDASNAGRESTLWGGGVIDPGSERMQARYVLVGDHVSGAEAVFAEAQLRLRHLDTWAWMTGTRVRAASDGSQATIEYERPAEESTTLVSPAGRLALQPVLTLQPPTVRGASIQQTAELAWRSEETALTVDQLWGRLVTPIRALLTLALDADTPAVSFEVRAAGEKRWLQVLHPGLDRSATEPLAGHEVLLSRHLLDLSRVGQWIANAAKLSPVPQLVTGIAVRSAERTVENQLLELAAAAEGLHRRLHPDQRAMTEAQARHARRDASYAVLKSVRQQVNARLGQLEEPTYLERLHVLAEEASIAAPGITGKTREWARLIRDSRNGFAHLLGDDKGPEVELEEYLVLRGSLRWLLTALLLQEAGVPADVLAGRQQHQPYLHFQRQARRWLPRVYGS